MSISSTTNIFYIYLQNVCKNYMLVDSLLEIQKDLYNVLFIQEPPWNFVYFVSFTTISGEDEVFGTPIHPDWVQVVQFPQNSEQTPSIMCFTHSRLFRLCSALRRDIVNHRDIQLLFFFKRGRCQVLINAYFDSFHIAVDFLSNKALNIPKLLYMREDINVRNAEQDLFVSLHPVASQALRDLADSYSLVHSILISQSL